MHAARRNADGVAALGRLPTDFFDETKVDVGGTLGIEPSRPCHPTCIWTCDKPACRNKCKPVCKAPKCVSACQKPKISRCRTICEDPKCAVVCPASSRCTSGDCPECHTVCGEPRCRLDCGQGRACRTTCADPECAWECAPAACPQPSCEMKCGAPRCREPSETLREVYAGHSGGALEADKGHAAQYLNREVAWSGLASVPEEVLAPGALAAPGARLASGALPAGGAGVPEAPKASFGAPCADFCNATTCGCGIAAEAKVADRVRWVVVARTP